MYFLVTLKILDNTMQMILENRIPSKSPQLLVVPQEAIRLTWAQPYLTWSVSLWV